MSYVDGFVLPVPRDKIEDYRAMASAALDVWMDHGALSAVEAMGDDVPDGKLTSFPLAVRLNEDEVVFFSFITYRDRAHRDEVNAKVIADPRTQRAPDDLFDARRMIFGGFIPIVRKGAAA